MNKKDTIILGIESSCDETSAAIIVNGKLYSNVIASQKVHEAYGGVVPELASRAHQANIVPVVHQAIKQAGIQKSDISGIAFTRGPGLMGALLVGTSFAKGFALANDIPLIEVNHLQGHILALFLDEKDADLPKPQFPFICLLVSGGHTQLMLVHDYFDMQLIGETIDDAAGEAFDKCGKVIGLPYPAGPVIDKYAKLGNAGAFKFNKPRVADFNYSFSGLKTSFLYTIRDEMKKNPEFVGSNTYDLCASLQKTIVDILVDKLIKATKKHGIPRVAVAGGVSANSGLRNRLAQEATQRGWSVVVPPIRYTTDNAAMIAITGYYKYLNKQFSNLSVTPKARYEI